MSSLRVNLEDAYKITALGRMGMGVGVGLEFYANYHPVQTTLKAVKH